MQKKGKEKLAQKVLQCMDLKSTLLSIFMHTSNSITPKLLILTMKRFTKLTSASLIISPMELSWRTILAGEHSLRTMNNHDQRREFLCTSSDFFLPN